MKDTPLNANEVSYLQSLMEFSKQVIGLQKQKGQYEMIIKKLEELRKKIQKGQIPMPVTIAVSPNMLYAESDKKVVLEHIDEQLTSYKNALKGINGQLEQRKEQFLEMGARVRDWAKDRFTNEVKAISSIRRSKKDEEVLFEKEFEELLKSEEAQKEFKKAVKKAQQKNRGKK